MSTNKKKAALLAKLKRQKEKQKKKVFTIPKIRLSTRDKKRKAEKSFVPTTTTLAKKSKSEDEMRAFLASVNDIGDSDWRLDDDKIIIYTDKKINNAFEAFIKDHVSDAIRLDEDADRKELNAAAKDAWRNLSTGDVMKWIIIAHGLDPYAEWGRKQFAEEVNFNIRTEEHLRQFIQDYLNSNITYDKFLQSWIQNKGKAAAALVKKEVKQEGLELATDKIGKRLQITEAEQEKINDLQERLDAYTETAESLKAKEEAREEELYGLSRDELIEIVTPIIAKKTDDELISFLVNSKYIPRERKRWKKIYGSMWEEYRRGSGDKSMSEKLSRPMPKNPELDHQWKLYMDKIGGKKATYETNLRELSRGDLILEATNKKDNPDLIKLILLSEFKDNLIGIRNKIHKLSIQIHNLSLGTYVKREHQARKLTSFERNYATRLAADVRKADLNIMRTKQLKTIAAVTEGVPPYKKKHKSSAINAILRVEFPSVDLDAELPRPTRTQLNNILRSLTEEQIRVVGFTYGVSRPEERGKHQIIDIILRKEFPVKRVMTKRLLNTFDKRERMKELEIMPSEDIFLLAFQLGIPIPDDARERDLINKILVKEEKANELVTEDEYEKRQLIKKITKITGRSAKRYSLWDLEGLKQRLEALSEEDDDYMIELEKERLLTKLKQIGNMDKYPDASTWSTKKLRQTLESIGGPDWENYRPLIEDYSFVKCMQKYQKYPWIEGKVTGVWLTSPKKGKHPKSEYIFRNTWIIEDKRKWYQADKNFFALQCNSNKNKRSQKGDVLTCYTEGGKPVRFRVGFTIIGYEYPTDIYQSRTHMVEKADGTMVQRSFIIQDEVMFRKERNYDRKTSQKLHERIKYIENSPVTERSVDIAMQALSRALLEVAPISKSDYGIIHSDDGYKRIDYNTPYMQVLIDTLREGADQTNQNFFTKIANIIVYLRLPEAKMFKANIAKEYYLPDILATLSEREKFPEVFDDPSLSPKFIEGVVAKINNNVRRQVNDFAEALYLSEDPTRRRSTRPTSYIGTDIKTRKRLSACENKDRVRDAEPTEIIYYKDDDEKIYCFTVNELYERFIDGNIINPETGKQFRLPFVQRFEKVYNDRLASDGFLTTYFQEKYGFDMDKLVNEKREEDTIAKSRPPLAPNLWDLVGKDIAELEDQMSNEEPGDGDEIDENREQERRELEVESGERTSEEINPDDACIYCKKHLSDDSIKSVIMHGDESRIIKFCSFQCFEDKNDWAKFKKKAKKAKRKKDKRLAKKIAAAKKKVEEEYTKKNRKPPPPKLSKEEIKRRKKLIAKRVKEGTITFDRMAFPLMTKAELQEIAKEKGVKIQGNISKMRMAQILFKALHPKSRKGIFKEDEASRRMHKV